MQQVQQPKTPADSPVPPSAVVGFYGFQYRPVCKQNRFSYPPVDLTSLLRCTIELFSQPDGVVPGREMRGLMFSDKTTL
jgi:hypothetical protein